MGAHSRYNAGKKDLGLTGEVFPNKADITNQKDLDDAETLLLKDTYEHFFQLQKKQQLHFDLDLLLEIHKFFLGNLYDWAGKIRTVDISKDETLFAPVEHIYASLKEFSKILQENLPNKKDMLDQVAEKIASIHCELNAIHPFREGNGRTIRLFLDLLVRDVGYVRIDWSKASDKEYIQACISGMSRVYAPMAEIIRKSSEKNI